MPSLQLANLNKPKIGQCPHGMLGGACPICNGMGGGGGAQRKPDGVRNLGEMSWAECFAAGLRIQADKKNQQALLQARLDTHALLLKMQTALANLANKLNDLPARLSNTPLAPLAKFVNIIAKNILVPILNTTQRLLNFVQNTILNVQNFAANLREQILGVQDKLAAIFGEFQNAKEKSISERLKKTVKKAFSLFFLTEDEDEEAIRVEQEHRALEMKKIKDEPEEWTQFSNSET